MDKGVYRKGRKIGRIKAECALNSHKRWQVRTAKMKSIKHEKIDSTIETRCSCTRGFTLAEMILVVVILSIAALMALPFAVSGSSMQLRSAANVIAADLEYAKSMAISRGQNYWVVFDTANESYQIEDEDGLVKHPIKKGFDYIVNFAADSRLNRVDISSVNFDSSGSSKVGLNYLGSPLKAEDNYLNDTGEIVLSAGGSTMVVNVEPVTGYITITQ